MKESRGFFQDIEKEKYSVAVGGKNPSDPSYSITPTIVDRDGTTGPTIPLLGFGTCEAIPKANNTLYGLGASVCSSSGNKIAEQIEAGNVWANTHFELDPRVTFGGQKESGIGTEWEVGWLKSYGNLQILYLKEPGAPMSDPPLVG